MDSFGSLIDIDQEDNSGENYAVPHNFKIKFEQGAIPLEPAIQPMTSNSTEKSESSLKASNIKLPPFWKNEPELWFAHVEAIFYTHRIIADEEKYFFILAALHDPDVLRQVTDIIKFPPASDKYSSVRSQLISRFSDSKETQLNKLFSELSLEGRKPSQLLREMRNLASNDTSEAVLQTLWLKRMPTSVRCILSAADVDLNKLSEIADKIIQHSSSMAQIETTNRPDLSDTLNTDISDRLSRLEKQTSELMMLVKRQNDKSSSEHQNFRSSRSKTRTSSQKRSLTPRTTTGICYYHNKFGENAYKCKKPCTFQSSSSSEN